MSAGSMAVVCAARRVVRLKSAELARATPNATARRLHRMDIDDRAADVEERSDDTAKSGRPGQASPPPALFRSQRHQRVHSSSPNRRDDAGDECRGAEDPRHYCEHDWIARLNFE